MTAHAPVRFALDNGLKVVLEENHGSQVVAFQAWVDVGSADEPEELAGIAHVFEHMLFKGTAKRGVGQIAQEVEGAGGDINAWTSYDQTVYHLVLASRFFDTGLDILADAIQRSSFDPEELQRELKVVLEEVKQGEDSPGRIASEKLFSNAFSVHPYRRPVIGWSRTVETFTRERLVDFFRSHYVPSRITLIVVGDFKEREARARIDAAFGRWKAPPAEVLARPAEPPQRAPRVVISTGDVKESQLRVAFHAPSLRDPDAGALDLLAVLLGQGESSRLSRELKRNREVATDAWAYSYTPKDPGLVVAGATMPPEKLERAAEALLEQVFQLAVTEAAAEEVDKARAILESDTIYQKETVQGQARKLGFYETVAGTVEWEAEYQRQLRAATPASIRAAAAKYLRPDNCTLLVHVPATVAAAPEKGATPKARAAKGKAGKVGKSTPPPAALDEAKLSKRLTALLGESWRRSEAIAARPAAIEGEVIRETLPNGARVLLLRDASIPLVALRAVWNGGQLLEDGKTSGISSLLATLLTRGTRTLDGEAIAHEVESMAGSLGGFSGRNSFGVRAELLSRHLDRGLELLADCVLHPAFAEPELEKERRAVLDELRAQEDNVGSVAFRLFNEAIYPVHPYRFDTLGNPESVAGLSRRRVADYYARHYPASGMTLAVVGDFAPERVLSRLRALFPADGEPARVGPKPGKPERAALPPVFPSEPVQVWKQLNKQQAHLVVGFPGITLSDPDRFALEVLSTVLSGQGGRLFLELRDKRGLAYRVSAFSVEGLDPGYFAVYIATSPQNLQAAETGIRDELNKIIDRVVPEDELERAKRYLAGTHDISLQRRAALAATLAFHESYGLGWDEYRRYAPAILAVTAADVRRVARRYLDPKRAVIAVVTPEEITPAIDRQRAQVAARRSSRDDSTRKQAQAALRAKKKHPRRR